MYTFYQSTTLRFVYMCVYKSFAKSNLFAGTSKSYVGPNTLIETCFVLPKTIHNTHTQWQQNNKSHTSPHRALHDSHGVRSCDFKLTLLTKMIYVYWLNRLLTLILHVMLYGRFSPLCISFLFCFNSFLLFAFCLTLLFSPADHLSKQLWCMLAVQKQKSSDVSKFECEYFVTESKLNGMYVR